MEQVLLGFLDKEVDTDTIEVTATKIGGLPVWKDKSVIDLQLRCKVCGRWSSLLSQIYCPIGASRYHRVLFIFCCLNPPCWNNSDSWWVVRCQTEEETGSLAPQVNNTWLDDQDAWDEDTANQPFGNVCRAMEDIIVTSINDGTQNSDSQFQTQCQDDEMEAVADVTPEALSGSFLTDQEPPWKKRNTLTLEDDSAITFQPYFVSVSEEPIEVEDSDEHVQQLLQQYQAAAGNPFSAVKNSAEGGKMARESYEKTEVKHGDKIFYKFCKRVKRCADQIIRYNWCGEPLLISPVSSEFARPCCLHCSGETVFELQMMPALLPKLKLLNSAQNDVCLEFGTVLIFSCKASCWSHNDRTRFEMVLVQPDPYQQLFDKLQ